MAKMSNRDKAIAKNAGVFQGPKSVADRKAAAASMKSAGVQSLSGLSGSQGQVARFKSEQNNLRNEYKDKNTSDERKEEIVKDLRGVSRDLNDQSRAAALNQVIREFGPGSVTNTGGIMGADAGARFQQLRGNPNFFVDGGPGTDTFVGNQREFKRGNITNVMGGIPKAFGDKNLFKQVHPNPLKVLLGAATQMGNLSPMGLVRNIEKIRTGQPLIDMSFMDRNKSESPSRMKDFYSAYMEGMNKKIADLKSSKNKDQFDAVPIDPQFQNVGEEPLDYGAQIANEIFSEDPTGDPTRIAEDKDLEEDMERSLLNQYSLLEDPGLADKLLDDTEETDLEEAINPDDKEEQEYNEMIAGMPFDRPDYEQEFIDTFGVPMKGDITAMSLTDGSPVRGLGDRLTRERFALDNNIPLDQIGEVYPKVTRYPTRNNTYTVFDPSSLFDADQLYDGETGFSYDNTVYSDKVSDTPKLGQEIRGFNINNPSLMPGGDSNIYLGYPGGIGLNDVENMVNTINRKDGGSVNTYDVLKLINDTMNDG